ncbi:hypothetical protein [uncultured Sphaerochaeta sp.]|uniref:hypothetical protein n=1 Tax=uncultured Sphaerochaeta sp. TaxID=886478 RepID=UPI002A0A983C|nr:hypothetical protein [uncultured Sphaerochaeta sp.]
MGKNFRFFLLVLQGLLTLVFTLLFSYSLYQAIQQGAETGPLISYYIPALLHLFVTLAAAILLSKFYRSNIGAEAQFLPILFLVIALENVKVLPVFFNATHHLILNFEWISIIFQFCFLFSSFLFLASSLFLQNLNISKLGQYIAVSAAWSLFLSFIVPISTNASSYYKVLSIASKPLVAVCMFITILAILTFLISFLRDMEQRHILARCLSFTLIILGNTMMILSQVLSATIVGLFFYIFGITFLLFTTRTYHIWT